MRHPLHPVVVHFPIACWSLVTLGDWVGIFWANDLVIALVQILLIIGCITALIAMMAGLYEITRLADVSQPVQLLIDYHQYAAIISLSLYSMSLFIRWDSGITIQSLWVCLSSTAGFISLMVTGWYGGRLVYQHRVGSQ